MDNNITRIWSISLLVITIVTIIWVASKFVGIELSDTALRIMGIMDILAIPVLVYASKKKKLN